MPGLCNRLNSLKLDLPASTGNLLRFVSFHFMISVDHRSRVTSGDRIYFKFFRILTIGGDVQE